MSVSKASEQSSTTTVFLSVDAISVHALLLLVNVVFGF
jgi:hypothetical protein